MAIKVAVFALVLQNRWLFKRNYDWGHKNMTQIFRTFHNFLYQKIKLATLIWPRTYKININKEYKTHTFLKYFENEEIQSENIQFFFFIQTPLKFDIDPKEQHKLIYRRRRNYVVYKEMHSTSIKSKHRILICPFYIQIMGLHFKSFDVGMSPFSVVKSTFESYSRQA